jgi:hypothetical protein
MDQTWFDPVGVANGTRAAAACFFHPFSRKTDFLRRKYAPPSYDSPSSPADET